VGIEVVLPAAPLSTVGNTNQSVPVNPVPSTPVSNTAAVNTAVVITINGVAGQAIRLTHLSFSYSAAPTGGNVTVVVNAVTIFQLDIASVTDFAADLPAGGLECAAGQSCVITLAAAGAAVVGKLNAASYFGA
jgi:hypothetical protein